MYVHLGAAKNGTPQAVSGGDLEMEKAKWCLVAFNDPIHMWYQQLVTAY